MDAADGRGASDGRPQLIHVLGGEERDADEFPESDWKTFRELRQVALERFWQASPRRSPASSPRS